MQHPLQKGCLAQTAQQGVWRLASLWAETKKNSEQVFLATSVSGRDGTGVPAGRRAQGATQPFTAGTYVEKEISPLGK